MLAGEIVPRIYGAPKNNKDGIPLRLIVNTIRSPTYLLVKFVTKALRSFVGNTDSYINDSSDFVKLLKNERINPEECIINFDRVFLFTKSPLSEVIQVIRDVFYLEMDKLAEVWLRSTFFSFRGEYYE